MPRIIGSSDVGYADLCYAQADVAAYGGSYWRRVLNNTDISFVEITRVVERDSFGVNLPNAFAPYPPVIRELSDDE